MPLRTTIRILLSLAVVLIAVAGGAHGSAHADRAVVTAQAGNAARVVEGGCASGAQTPCQLLALAEDRLGTWTHVGELRAARLFAADDPLRSGSDPLLEDKPPRLF